MNIKYFRDTDTAHLEFSGRPVEETRELSENVYVDLDKDGNLVGWRLDIGRGKANLPLVAVGRLGQGGGNPARGV